MDNTNNLDARTVTIQRTFDAPLALVWQAWTQPEHLMQWWNPQGMPTEIAEHHFHVGGTWKYVMTMPDGNEFISEGVYKEIVEFERIVSTANFRPMTEGVEIQALFKADGDKTQFMFHVVHPTEAYKIQQEKMGIYNGWGSVFDRLGTFLVENQNR
ncbi:MAG: SRPBCC domain-containing protein [Flavobacteriaceae bacterium]